MYYLTQGLHRALSRHPDDDMLVWGDESLTFRKGVDRISRVAGGLKALGMKSNDRVAILALNSVFYFEMQMAILWAGGVMNPCNTRWSKAEIIYSLVDCESSILIIDDNFIGMLPELLAGSPTIKKVVHFTKGAPAAGAVGYEDLALNATAAPDAMRADEDLAGVFYTGGTTGFPKGVMLTHSNLFASALMFLAEGNLDSRPTCYLHSAPMFHLADFGLTIPYYLRGAKHAALPAFTAEGFLDAVEKYRATDVLLVPTMIQMVVDSPAIQKPRDVGSLRRISYGASVVSEAVLDRAMKAFPGVQLQQAYGMTELSPIATVLTPEHHTVEGRKQGKLRSGGRAAVLCEVKVVDANDEEVPRGTVGEVIVRGPGVMEGYWNKPDQTAAALKGGWMHTGDGAYMDADGFVFIVDRLKDMIVSGGENVYSAEVENAIGKHPAVLTCAVIGIPSERWGESVHAVVVCREGQTLTEEELATHVKSLIAGYKCPRSMELTTALPMSGAGKILKTVLREKYWKDQSRNV